MLFSDGKKKCHFFLCTMYCCILKITHLTQIIQWEQKKLKYNTAEYKSM